MSPKSANRKILKTSSTPEFSVAISKTAQPGVERFEIVACYEGPCKYAGIGLSVNLLISNLNLKNPFFRQFAS